MNNFTSAFQKGKAFFGFLTCGDPDLETTAATVRAMAQNGADCVELNIPFSDPTAVDPTIQEANLRALSAGVTTDTVFDFIAALRQELTVPLVISTYANVVLSYGPQRFLEKCAQVGVQGLLVPDLPFEEQREFLPQCQACGVDLISMVAVTSRERVAAIAREATGFLYIMACPGTREQELTDLMAQVRSVTDLPCVICLNGTEDLRIPQVAARTDGVAVDTPLVALGAQYGAAAPGPIGDYTARMKAQLQAI